MTAGGRIRFKTDSDYIIVQANITAADTFGQPQSSMLAKHGFNFYVKEGGVQKFGGIFFTYQGGDCTGFAEGRVRLKPGMKEITLYLPLLQRQTGFISLCARARKSSLPMIINTRSPSFSTVLP